ncbi:MAG: adenylate/guanylate cyclase domain-containing protein [Bradymonadaceae bacterium]
MAKVSYRDSDGVLQEEELDQDVTTLGRHPNQSIQVLDRVVSKEHAVVERGPDGYYLEDDDSRNGTYLNGELIEDRVWLADGDRITIGSTNLYFQQDVEQQEQFRRGGRGTVTIHESDDVETHIQESLSQNVSDQFLPEQDVQDENVLRRDYEKLRIAYELSRAIGLEMDLEALLEKLLDKAFELFPADRGVILLREGKEGELVPMEVKSRTEEDAQDVSISQTILDQVIDNKEAVLSSDAMSDSRFSGSESIMIGKIRSTMSVPMLHDDELKGVIHLDTKMASGAFTDKDLQILSGFARRAAELVEHHRLLKRMEEEIVVREKVRRLLPPELVEEVVEGRVELEKGGELREATVMFADIRNFTSFSEHMPPQEVVGNLNEYFELMVDVVFKYEGTLDKFIGDEIMAIWGAPISKPDDAVRAVRCANALQETIEEFNREREKEGRVTFEIGVGLNTGELVAGYMGSTKRMNYTVMGDVVNTANRICGLADESEILMGENTFREVGHLVDFERMAGKKLEGKREEVDIYRITGVEEESSTEDEPTLPERSFE